MSRTPETEADNSSQVAGTVLAVQANYYKVRLDAPITKPETRHSSTLLCTRRSRLKKMGLAVRAGDRVLVEEPDWEGERGAIGWVFPRQTELDRPPIANANHILLVFALVDPMADPNQISRFLIKAESAGLEVSISLNKSDIASLEERQYWQERLRAWGYEPLFISVQTGFGVDLLSSRLQNRITVISGPSGVGKSSLINLLIPTLQLRVGKVSGKLGRGRHTTRHVELFDLPGGGLLADTPGFDRPELDCSPLALAHCFPEARYQLANLSCQFSDCLHRDEPNCAVRGDWERYELYLQLLEEAIAREDTLRQQAVAETNQKLKTKRSGKREYEPKLETKKYRRVSRRRQHQNLMDFHEDLREEDSGEA